MAFKSSLKSELSAVLGTVPLLSLEKSGCRLGRLRADPEEVPQREALTGAGCQESLPIVLQRLDHAMKGVQFWEKEVNYQYDEAQVRMCDQVLDWNGIK